LAEVRFDGDAPAEVIIERVLISSTIIDVQKLLWHHFRVHILLNNGFCYRTVIREA
jgi:hypothetical protein